MATRKAYGDALKALGGGAATSSCSTPRFQLDAPEVFREAYPDRFFEMFIAEQQMVAAAVGM